MQHQFESFNELPLFDVILGAESVLKLHAFRGYSIMVEEGTPTQDAWCIVETEDGTIGRLQLPPMLYYPFVRAGAVAGQTYLISRNENAVRNVYCVRELNNKGE